MCSSAVTRVSRTSARSRLPNRRLVFSVHDFDESLPGPFEWDVKRLAASFAVAGRDSGFNTTHLEPINVAVGRSYRDAMRDFSQMRTLDLWCARLDVEDLAKRWAAQVTGKQLERFDRNVAKARAKDSLRASGRLTEIRDGRPRIISDPPLIVPIEELLPEARVLEDAVRQAGMDRAHARRRRRRAVPAVQGGRGIGAGAVPGQQRVRHRRASG